MEKLKGSLYVALAAASYGVLASIVKYANMQGVHISLLTGGQFFFGLLILGVLQIREKKRPNIHDRKSMLLYGLSFGGTSIFYYISLLYIPVSFAIILLMQAIWMGVVLEIIQTKKVQIKKVLGAALAILGTLFAADIFNVSTRIHPQGILFGLLAALSYTCNMYASNKVATNMGNLTRSFYFILGGSIAVCAYWNLDLLQHFEWKHFLYWGIPLALFGTIIPPILFTIGMPKIGTGLGGIVSSFEIPVSLACAYYLLDESLNTFQWVGVLIILISIVLINLNKKGRTN